MDKIFLVKNTQDNHDNGTILSICPTREAADRVADPVINNFKFAYKDIEIDFIEVEEIELREDVDIMWDLYP